MVMVVRMCCLVKVLLLMCRVFVCVRLVVNRLV